MRRRSSYYSQPPRKPVIAWSQEHDAYAVRSDFKQEYVDALKTDTSFRVSPRWNGPGKFWLINEIDIDVLRQIVSTIYGDFDFIPKQASSSQSGFSHTNTSNGGNSFRKMFEIAGPELSNKFWKSILIATHPDKGGDPELATACNVAWDSIKRDMNWS